MTVTAQAKSRSSTETTRTVKSRWKHRQRCGLPTVPVRATLNRGECVHTCNPSSTRTLCFADMAGILPYPLLSVLHAPSCSRGAFVVRRQLDDACRLLHPVFPAADTALRTSRLAVRLATNHRPNTPNNPAIDQACSCAGS